MAAGDRATSSGAGRTAARPQPRPRAQVASSTPSAARNAARASGATNCQAAIRSTAGSPTASVPKSITAARRPSRTSRLPGAGSPWTQTGGPSHGGAASAASHAAVIGGGVEDTVERGDHGGDARRHDRRVARVVERAAAEAVAPLRRRAAVGVDPLQCGEERGEVERGPPRVGERRGRRRLAVEPAQHRPGIRVALGGGALRQRLGDRQREPRREPRQPRLLALDLPDPALVAREPHRHRVAEPVGVVVPSGLGDRGHRQAGPRRELARDQPPDEVRVDPGRVRHPADRTRPRAGPGVRRRRRRSRREACSWDDPGHVVRTRSSAPTTRR